MVRFKLEKDGGDTDFVIEHMLLGREQTLLSIFLIGECFIYRINPSQKWITDYVDISHYTYRITLNNNRGQLW